MNPGEVQQPALAPARKHLFQTPLGVLMGMILGALIGGIFFKTLSLGERTQQMNLTNTGSNAMLVKINTIRWGGDGDVVIEPGKTGHFIYGEGDELSIFPSSQATGDAHHVTLQRKSIEAEANADDKGTIEFAYNCE